MASSLFWLLWGVGILVLGSVFLRGLLHPIEMTGLPFVVTAFSAYFYVFMSFEAAIHLAGYLPPWTLELGHLCAVLGVTSLWLGWWLSTRRAELPEFPGPGSENRAALFHVGLSGLLLGALGNWSFDAFNTEGFGESAYWYMASQVAFPGAAACIIALVQDRRLRTPFRYLLVAAPILYLLVPFLLGARRGPTMAWLLTVLFSVVLGSRRIPSRRSVLIGLVASGTIALTIFSARGLLQKGESMAEAVSAVSLEDIAFKRTRQVADNEYVYHCALIATTLETGRYQYGTGHLGVLLHWIPRSLWPDKPSRGGGLFPDARAYMPAVTGITMGRGMAAGAISDTFVQYGFFFPLFWALLGWVAGLVWVRAMRPDDWFWKVTLVNMLSCTHWLVAQAVAAFAVPLLLGQLVPLLGALYVRHTAAAALRWHPRALRQ